MVVRWRILLVLIRWVGYESGGSSGWVREERELERIEE